MLEGPALLLGNASIAGLKHARLEGRLERRLPSANDPCDLIVRV
ncbi:hypothetical protein ACI6Q5_21840 [Xanthomonas codiaei]|uniref:Uncharacterized protein n=1 Tax=Xanthomonas codiaei TaxID=56463 RepID=A0ABW9MTI8_9XANT